MIRAILDFLDDARLTVTAIVGMLLFLASVPLVLLAIPIAPDATTAYLLGVRQWLLRMRREVLERDR